MIRAADESLRFQNPLTLAEQRALIALSLVPGVGPGRIERLVESFHSAQDALEASPRQLAHISGIGEQTALSIASFDDEPAVARQIERANQVGAEMVTKWDHRYPALLRQIYDPPAFLWVRGVMHSGSQDSRSIAIVGTRRPTDYGRRVAHEFASVLARLGFTIVSGLAYGIDGEAHRAAVEAGGRTIAVLGSGADRIYPSRHARLAREMLERGAVISEYPMGEKPDAPNFPRRNRVISGMSKGVIIVEAYQEGGALITARLAVEQNREVFAVPGPIHKKSSRGANALIRDGTAKLVQQLEDVLDELGFEETAAAAASETAFSLDDLPPEEQVLCQVLTTEPAHIDRICAASGLDPATALVYLLSLEFKGVVRQLAGKQFFLARPVVSAAELEFKKA